MKWNSKYPTQDICICYVVESFRKGSSCHSWLNSHINNLPISTSHITGLLFHIKYSLYEYDRWHDNKEQYLRVKTKQMLVYISLIYYKHGFCYMFWPLIRSSSDIFHDLQTKLFKLVVPLWIHSIQLVCVVADKYFTRMMANLHCNVILKPVLK